MRLKRRLAALAAVLAIALLTSDSTRAAGLSDWATKVDEFVLPNGMTFLLYERRNAPIFSAYIRFRAGGMDEGPGQTGLAHFLEHMAFKGTKMLGTTDFEKEKVLLDQIAAVGEALSQEYAKGAAADPSRLSALRGRLKELHAAEEKYIVREAIARQMLENGGIDYNATTSQDLTSYFVTLPADKVRFWAELESERIFRPVFREFYEEKDVVLEERRMRVDNDPDGRLHEAFLATAFQASPYRNPTIGRVDDIQRLTLSDLEKFWSAHYAPSNAVASLVGDFDTGEIKKILRETFGKVEFPVSKQDRTPATPAGEPRQTEERRVAVVVPAAPRVWIGYHKPPLPSREDYVCDLLDVILGGGRTSRLYKVLVTDAKIAADVQTYSGFPGARLANLFLVEINLLQGRTPAEAVARFDRVLQDLAGGGVTERELQKAKNRILVDMLWQMRTAEGLSSLLSYYQATAGNWRYLASYLEEMEKLGVEDVRDVLARLFVPANRTIGILEPAKGGGS